MRLLTTLLLLLCVASLARFYPHLVNPPLPDAQIVAINASPMMTVMTAGFLLLAAWLTGTIFHAMNLPRISGYLLLGLVVGPAVLGLIPAEQTPQLSFANDLAIAVIALTAGAEIRLDFLRNKIKKLAVLIGVDVAIVMTIGLSTLLLASPWISFLQDQTWLHAGLIALAVSVVMISNSPAVIIAMIAETESKGPMTQTALSLAVLKDLVLIVLFAVVLAVAKGVMTAQGGLSGGFVLGLGFQLIGSIILGGLLGLLMALYVRQIAAHMTIFLIGACMFFALLGEMHFSIAGQDTHLETLLMALAAGMLLQNVWPRRSEPLFVSLHDMSLPVYCLFFALAGVKIHLDAMATLWYISLGMVAVRAGAVYLGINTGLRLAGFKGDWQPYLWLTMIPQAGVSLVLVIVLEKTFPDTTWAPMARDMLIGMIVVHELLGPVGMRYALIKSGEAGADDGAAEGETFLEETYPGDDADRASIPEDPLPAHSPDPTASPDSGSVPASDPLNQK